MVYWEQKFRSHDPRKAWSIRMGVVWPATHILESRTERNRHNKRIVILICFKYYRNGGHSVSNAQILNVVAKRWVYQCILMQPKRTLSVTDASSIFSLQWRMITDDYFRS